MKSLFELALPTLSANWNKYVFSTGSDQENFSKSYCAWSAPSHRHSGNAQRLEIVKMVLIFFSTKKILFEFLPSV